MELKEIKEILKLHKLWLANDPNGKCADFSNMNIRDSNFSCCNFSKANFANANAQNSDFRGSVMVETNFTSTNFKDANLSNATLTNANLTNADFRDADLDGIILTGTILENMPILKFQLNKHTAHYFGGDVLRIGCHTYSLKDLYSRHKEIGKEQGYTDLEIEQYGKFLKICINFALEMKNSQ